MLFNCQTNVDTGRQVGRWDHGQMVRQAKRNVERMRRYGEMEKMKERQIMYVGRNVNVHCNTDLE